MCMCGIQVHPVQQICHGLIEWEQFMKCAVYRKLCTRSQFSWFMLWRKRWTQLVSEFLYIIIIVMKIYGPWDQFNDVWVGNKTHSNPYIHSTIILCDIILDQVKYMESATSGFFSLVKTQSRSTNRTTPFCVQLHLQQSLYIHKLRDTPLL